MKHNKLFKKIIGFTVCTFIILSQCIGFGTVFASTDDAVKIFYRDYEDYAGAREFINKSQTTADYGTATGFASDWGFSGKAESIKGKNGNGVCFNTENISASKSWDLAFNKTLSSGILYFAYDVKFASEIKNASVTSFGGSFIKLKNTSGTAYAIEAIGSQDGNNVLYKGNDTSWNVIPISDLTFNSNDYYRIEVTYDVLSKECKYYVNGEYKDSKIYSADVGDISGITLGFSNIIDYFDSFTIMHYPNGVENDSYLTAVCDGAEGNSYITADFKDYTTGGSVLINNLTAQNIAVKDNLGNAAAVVGVENLEQTGRYKINISAKLNAGLYTVTFADSVCDTIGKKLSAGKCEFNVSAKKIFYRDYEDYTGSAAFLNKSASTADYGMATGFATGTFAYAATAVNGKNGNGVCFNSPNVTSTNTSTKLLFNKELSSGILYTAFDAKFAEKSATEKALMATFIKLYNKEETSPYGFVGIAPDYTLRMGSSNGTGWDANKISEFAFDSSKTYKTEVIYNLDTKLCSYYVDGVLWGTKTTTKGNDGINAMQIQLSNLLEYFDNFTVVHYPVSPADDAKMTASITANAGTNAITFNVFDSMLGSGQIVNALKTTGNITIKNSNNETVEVTGITDGEKTGEYVITLANNITAGEYTAQIASTVTDTIGKPFENYTVSFTAQVLKPSADVVINGNTARVTYYNFTTAYSGKVYAAAYINNLLIGAAVQNADIENGNTVSVTVPDEYSSDNNITYKVFIWDDNLSPLGSYNE